MQNEGGMLNPKVVKNLSYHPPTKQTVNNYISLICKQYEIDYTPTIELSEQDLTTPEPVAEIPVTTGMKDTDDDIKKMRNLQYLDVMPPPFAPGYDGDNASVTSSSSRSSGGNPPPPPADAPMADAPMAVAMAIVTRQ